MGDELLICRAPAGPTDIDKVRLVDWRPGLRSTAGGDFWLALPVVAVDAEARTLVLGHGALTLTVPMLETGYKPGMVVQIDHLNRIRVPSADPQRRRLITVLLTVDAQGVPRIAGWPEHACRLDAKVDWDQDPFGKHLLYRGRPGPMLLAAGGVVPVTVEYMDDEARLITVSRRFQHRPDRQAGISQARVLDLTGDARCVVRMGNEWRRAAVQELVAGVPAEHHEAVLTALKACGCPLWVRTPAGKPWMAPGIQQRDQAHATGSFLPRLVVH